MRLRRRIAPVLAFFTALLLFAVSAVVYSEFWVHQPGVEELIAALPPSERDLPPAIHAVFSKVDETEINRWIARNLLWQTTERTRMGRWHLRFALWELLVPYKYSRRVRLSLFAHFLVAESASGLEQVSETLFAKPAHQLSRDEAIGLLAVTRSPRRFSPKRHPDAYEKEVERLR
ncbi:MAG: transglycosylase domain-containing protein [Acidobacteriota bacterium]|nr:transglycosylase domain-containing protein [Acidobacteriota bacterium]